MEERLRAVGAGFGLPGELRDVRPYGSGHIHRTFVAEYAVGGRVQRYLHQDLNCQVFRDPDAVMANIVRVTEHLARKLAASGVDGAERRCLRVLRTAEGRPLFTDAEGARWRTFDFVEETRSCDTVESPAQAREAARAFGAFAALLADLGAPLAVTIPRFHDPEARAAQLEAAVRADARGRAAGARAEIEDAARWRDWLGAELPGPRLAALPRRPVHHDCKLNNLLFDAESGEALCVIDLDTVMPGTLLSDFGELVRTASCPAPEDERDLARVAVDEALYRALAGGYVGGVAPIAEEDELSLLPLAPVLTTFMNAARFLADHLAGDVYFRTHREGHNLDRARAQLRLVERLVAGLPLARDAVGDARGSAA